MDIRPIHSQADDKATLKEISALMDSDPGLGTPAGDRLDILATLVQAYEARHVPITAPDPVEAIKFRMPDERSVWSSLTHAKMMIFVLKSNPKNKRNRRPILARRQRRNAAHQPDHQPDQARGLAR